MEEKPHPLEVSPPTMKTTLPKQTPRLLLAGTAVNTQRPHTPKALQHSKATNAQSTQP